MFFPKGTIKLRRRMFATSSFVCFVSAVSRVLTWLGLYPSKSRARAFDGKSIRKYDLATQLRRSIRTTMTKRRGGIHKHSRVTYDIAVYSCFSEAGKMLWMSYAVWHWCLLIAGERSKNGQDLTGNLGWWCAMPRRVT
jgi:hypothetical protein